MLGKALEARREGRCAHCPHTLVRVTVAAVVQPIALQASGRALLHERERVPLRQHASTIASRPCRPCCSPAASVAGTKPRRARLSGAIEIRRGGHAPGQRLRLGFGRFYARGRAAVATLGLFGVELARLVVAEVADIAFDAPRTWSLLSTASACKVTSVGRAGGCSNALAPVGL